MYANKQTIAPILMENVSAKLLLQLFLLIGLNINGWRSVQR